MLQTKVFDIQTLLGCNSHHAVYVIQCTTCNKCYVVCTIRKVKTRIAEHLAAIARDQSHHSGAVAHFIHRHSGNIDYFIFYAIEGVARPNRGGDWRSTLLNWQVYWILRSKTRMPDGMNLQKLSTTGVLEYCDDPLCTFVLVEEQVSVISLDYAYIFLCLPILAWF